MENLRMWIPKKCASRLSTKQRREMCIRKEELQRLSIYATYTLYAYKTRVIIYKCYRSEKLDYPQLRNSFAKNAKADVNACLRYVYIVMTQHFICSKQSHFCKMSKSGKLTRIHDVQCIMGNFKKNNMYKVLSTCNYGKEYPD